MASKGRVAQFPRAVRPAPEPLAHYVHVGHNDHKALSDLIAAGDVSFFGLVLRPTARMRHESRHHRSIGKPT